MTSKERQVIFHKTVSGYDTKIEIWSEEERTLRVSIYDHTCYLRFMHQFAENAELADVFQDIMSRVKAAQLNYATEEWRMRRAKGDKSN